MKEISTSCEYIINYYGLTWDKLRGILFFLKYINMYIY